MSERASNTWYYQRKGLTPPALVGKDAAALRVTETALFAQIPAVPVAELAPLYRARVVHQAYWRDSSDYAAFLSAGGTPPPPPPASLVWDDPPRVPLLRPAPRIFAPDAFVPGAQAPAPAPVSFLADEPVPLHLLVRRRAAAPSAAELFVPTAQQPAPVWSDAPPLQLLVRPRTAPPPVAPELVLSVAAPPAPAGTALPIESEGARVWAWRQRWLFEAQPRDDWLPILGAQTPPPPAPSPGPSVYRTTYRVRRR